MGTKNYFIDAITAEWRLRLIESLSAQRMLMVIVFVKSEICFSDDENDYRNNLTIDFFLDDDWQYFYTYCNIHHSKYRTRSKFLR